MKDVLTLFFYVYRFVAEPQSLVHACNSRLRASVAKFSQNPAMGEFLLRTGERVLVEASPRDRIWGIGMGAANPDAEQPRKWRGQNLLGFALMAARAQLRAGQ